jgi:DNA repair protein SbcD/Mre11
MKIMHTSDWHLGKRLHRYSRIPEQKHLVDELVAQVESHDIDVILISGDLFDTYNPPTEAIDLFYHSLVRLSGYGKRAVIAIAGNHDSPDRIEAPNPLARECGILFAGYPQSLITPFELLDGLKILNSEPGFVELSLPRYEYPLRILLTPYANQVRLQTYLGGDSGKNLQDVLTDHWQNLSKKYCDENGVNLLMTHLMITQPGQDPPQEPDDEKPILHVGGAEAIATTTIPKEIQYTALGHLHRQQVIRESPHPVIYSGSPLAYSFAEADQNKYFMLLQAEPGSSVEWTRHALTSGKRLCRQRFSDVHDAVQWLKQHHDSWVELTMNTETFLSAKEKRQLLDSHEGITSIIPDLNQDAFAGDSETRIDLNRSIQDLFVDYFYYRHQQTPSDEHLDLFRELLAQEEEDEE